MTRRDTVLIVDDDALSRQLLTEALNDAGFPVETVTSGTEALTWLANNIPAMVLLDLVMPPPDGYVVLRYLRKQSSTQDLPVIVLTSLDGDDDVARSFEFGADDFVRKPFRPVELLARIRGQLRLRKYVDALARKEHDTKVVLELTQALSSTLDFRNILFTIVRRIAEVTRVDRCSIVLVRDKGDIGYVVSASDDIELCDLPLDLGKYPEIQRVMQTSKSLIIEDIKTHPLFDVVRAELPPDGFRSLALLPIICDDKTMGVLFLRSKQPVGLPEHELSLAHTLANAMAIALRNARTVQSLRDQTHRISFARFEAERQLHALQRYADFFTSAADGIVVMDSACQILFSNPRAQQITARTEQDLCTANLFDLVDPQDHSILNEIRAGFSGGIFAHMVDLTIRCSYETMCEKLILSFSFSSVIHEHGGAIVVSFRDVTLDRATAAELEKTKDFLERVIDSSVDAIVSADMSGTVLLFNRAAERLYGYDTKDVVGVMNIRSFYPEDDAKKIMRLIHGKEHGGPGRLQGYRAEVLAEGGTLIPVFISAALIFENGAPVGSVGVFTDLRERIRMETRLTEAEQELRSREKQAIVAELAGAAAHELNQPLTSVLGYSEMICRRVDEASPIFNAATVIRSEAERMAEIVRKIGKITRYETKSYVGEAKILDLDRSSGDDPSKAIR